MTHVNNSRGKGNGVSTDAASLACCELARCHYLEGEADGAHKCFPFGAFVKSTLMQTGEAGSLLRHASVL
jgi:hypothetical protein